MTRTFTITLVVTNARALHAAALDNYLTRNNFFSKANEDALVVLGEEDSPKIHACLLQLLDPGDLAGCEIQDSDVSGEDE